MVNANLNATRLRFTPRSVGEPLAGRCDPDKNSMIDPQTKQADPTSTMTPTLTWWRRQRQTMRWRMTYTIALAVLAVMIGANLLLLQRLQSVTRGAFEQDRIGRAEAVTADLTDRSLWLAGPEA